MRRLWASSAAALLSIVLGGVSVIAQSADPRGPSSIEQAGLTRDEAVALVLAQDARFTELPDFERRRIEMASQFSFNPIIASGFYRVLPTVTTQWSYAGPGTDAFVFRQPRNWLVEVVLVRDCLELVGGKTGQLDDPCASRHAWYYRVHPDGTVTLLFEEGDTMPVG